MENFEQYDDESLPMVINASNDVAIIDQISDKEEDYQKTRTNIYELIEKGKEGLEVALAMVQSTESPRSIEVFSSLLKTLADTNLQLLEIQKKKQDMTISSSQNDLEPNIKNQTINQTAIFAGTTSELAKLLSEMKNNEIK
jgi:hypothetical protein